MTKQSKINYRYSDCFKRSVVEKIEKEGLSLEEAQRRFGIGGNSTLQRWILKFGKNHLLHKVVKVSTLEERDELSALRAENRNLKIAYADLSLSNKSLVEENSRLSKMINN